MFYADSMVFFAKPGEPPILPFTEERVMHRPLDLAHLTSAPPLQEDFNETLAYHQEFKVEALSNANVHHVRSGSDLEEKGSTGVIFGLQHAPTGLTAARVCKLAGEGIRSMALAYRGRSEYGSSSDIEGGLTEAGRKLIQWMGQAGVILDLSRANEETAISAIRFITSAGLSTKVMVSHSGCKAIEDTPGNISNEVLMKLRDIDAYIGITIPFAGVEAAATEGRLADYVTKALNRFAEHVTHAVLKSGDDMTVGIGSDQFYRPGLIPIIEEKLGYLPSGIFGQNFKHFLERVLPC